MGSNAPRVTMLELVSAKWNGMKTWPGPTIPVMRSSRSGTAPRRLVRVTRSCGFQVEGLGVGGVHLEPGVGNHVVEEVNFGGLRTRVPVLHGSTGVEDQVVFRVGLFNKGIAGNNVEASAAVDSGENSILIERGAAPLDSIAVVDLLPGDLRVVAHAACGDALPLEVSVLGRVPAGVEFLADTELLGEGQEDIKIGSRIAGRGDHRVGLGDATQSPYRRPEIECIGSP